MLQVAVLAVLVFSSHDVRVHSLQEQCILWDVSVMQAASHVKILSSRSPEVSTTTALQFTHNFAHLAHQSTCTVCFLRLHCNAGVETVERRSLHSVRYAIPKTADMSLARVFRELEAAKSTIGIAEYSVGQQTLESIFNSFAARQDLADAEQQQ
jgi:hypothetical protein